MIEIERVVFGQRGELLVGAVSAGCEGRAAVRANSLRVGQGARGKEGALRAERGIVGGSCECLVGGQGSREGKCGVCRARVVEAGRLVSGRRGELLVGSVSAWCESGGAVRANVVCVGPGW